MRTVRFAVAFLAFSFPIGAVTQQPPNASELNAAVKYLRADASLRQGYPLGTDAWVKLQEKVQLSIDDESKKIVEASSEALSEFRHAANISTCDWQVSVEDGPFASTAHRGAIRELVAVALLRAKIQNRAGHPSEAMRDVLASYAAARHLSSDGSIASVLFGYAIEREITSVVQEVIPALSRSELQELQAGLSHLPSGSGMQNAFIAEKLNRNDILTIARSSKSRDDLIQRLIENVPALEGDKHKATLIVDGCGASVSGFEECARKEAELIRRWTAQFSLNPLEFETGFDSDFTRESADNPVAAQFTPSMSRMRWAEAYNATRRALVQAAIGVQLSGEPALLTYTDPYTQKSFRYAREGSGFRLDSDLIQDGKPVSLLIQ
jgi:hypothetical protein